MNADELCFLSITQLSELVQKGELSPVEVTQAHLNRIHTLDAKLNSYLTVTAELALQEAKGRRRKSKKESTVDHCTAFL